MKILSQNVFLKKYVKKNSFLIPIPISNTLNTSSDQNKSEMGSSLNMNGCLGVKGLI